MAVTRLPLPGDWTFATAHDRHGELTAALASGQALCLDLGGLESVDLAGLQLLYAAQADARERHLAFHIDAGPQTGRLQRLAAYTGLPALPLAPDRSA